AQICAQDPFCCMQAWDGICVNEVGSICGQPCGPCQPNGSMCAQPADCCSKVCSGGICGPAGKPNGQSGGSFAECCSQTCSAGVCGGACKPDGQSCMTAADCCSAQCNGGVCGAAMCPPTGNKCGDCTAAKCCAQLTACFNDPQCTQDVACFL